MSQADTDALIRDRVQMQQVELRSVRLYRFLEISMVVLCAYWGIAVVTWSGVAIIINSLTLLALALSFYLLKLMPHSRSASFVFLFFALGVIGVSGLFDGQLYSGALFLLPVPTMAAAFLLGKRWSIVTAVASVGIVAVNSWASWHYPLPKVYADGLLDRAILRLAMLGMLAGVALSSARSVRGTLAKIAQRKQEIRKATAVAKDAQNTKEAFLANMSHEIRTPLHGILGLSTQLERPGRAPKEAGQVKVMRACAEELLTLLNDVLDLSKIEAGKFVLREQAYCLQDVIEGLDRSFAPRAAQKAVMWSVSAPSQPLWLVGDAQRLQQVLENLLDNALSHSQTMRITLRVQSEGDDPVQLCFCVGDEGQGIGAAYLARLQSRFSAQTPTGTQVVQPQESLGLGLILCDRLVRLMGGGLGIESQSGKGTQVTLSLTQARAQARARLASAILEGKRVLVVDDGQINQRVAKLHLSNLGIRADLASDGHEALELCARTRYDVVMLDLRMPGLDGVETAQHLRQIAGYEDVPLVATTAEMDADWEARCGSVGMTEHLLKPFHPDALRTCLRKSLAMGANSRPDGGVCEQTG